MKRGGPRKGAGRKLGSTRSERTEKLMVRLTPHERAKAELIGEGNASKGLRKALSECQSPIAKSLGLKRLTEAGPS